MLNVVLLEAETPPNEPPAEVERGGSPPPVENTTSWGLTACATRELAACGSREPADGVRLSAAVGLEAAAASIASGDENICCTNAAMFCMVGGR